jgi:hypothetical protein
MMRPTPIQLKAFAQSIRSFPDTYRFIEDWYAQELDQLPLAITNPALSQGRCQVLKELVKLLKEAPDMAASLDRPPPSTHTG